VIVEGRSLEAPLRLRTHTVVVGSGSGGAVVARTLAEAGTDVIVLEEGGRFTAADFSQREEEMFPALYRSAAQQLTDDGLVNVLQGSCFGGSTVVNTADCVPIPAAVLAHWSRHFGVSLDEEELEASRARVFAALRVNRIPRGQLNANNALVLEAGARIGLATGSFDHNRVGCLGSGYCLIGCAYDAKLGANLTYLPAAAAAGAQLYTDLRAERIERRVGGRLAIHGSVLARATRSARFPFVVLAERAVLAAGAVHTPALLLRSGLGRGLPALGRNLSLQPQLPVVAGFDDGRRIELWRGIPQSAFASAADDDAEHGLGGFHLEGINGALANAAALLPGFGHAHKQRMSRFAAQASALLLVPDRPSGSVGYAFRAGGETVPRIRYRMQREWQARLRAGMRRAAELYFEAGAARVGFTSDLFPDLEGPDQLDRIERFPIVPGATRFISAHPQGSCRMGPDARASVVDSDHRVHGLSNLYVVDASVMPTSAATHTMIPIMTLADRAARRMLEGGGAAGRASRRRGD
jgi:choline dehydrogenase-like flavoprotein